MMVRKLKFAAVAAISLLGLSFEAAPATAGGCWYDGCGSAVIVQPVPVYPSARLRLRLCGLCWCWAGLWWAMGWAMVVAMGWCRAAIGGYRGPMEAIVAVSIVGAPSEDIVAVSIVGPPMEAIAAVSIGGATSYS